MAGATVMPAFLSSLRSTPFLPQNVYYLLAGTALSVLNLPQEIPFVLRFALERGGDRLERKPDYNEQLTIARRMREAIIKVAPIAGLPKSINAMVALKSTTPASLLDEPLAYSPTGRPVELQDMPSSAILSRGQQYFSKTYGKVTRRVMSQLDRSGTEDLGNTARLMYGYILSNTSVLDARETSYVLLAGLIPQDVNAQLKGHLQGARNHGATTEEVKAVRQVVLMICEILGMKIMEKGKTGWGWKEPVANL